jgi:hypothetical protein
MRQEQLLRTAFACGAATDALAVVPMLSPRMAALLWGFDEPTGAYRFAMGYAASLMLGWTGLLVWAYQRPLERRFVAALTVFVIHGLALTEIAAVLAGHLPPRRMIPTWILQSALLALFAGAYHYPRLIARRAAS